MDLIPTTFFPQSSIFHAAFFISICRKGRGDQLTTERDQRIIQQLYKSLSILGSTCNCWDHPTVGVLKERTNQPQRIINCLATVSIIWTNTTLLKQCCGSGTCWLFANHNYYMILYSGSEHHLLWLEAFDKINAIHIKIKNHWTYGHVERITSELDFGLGMSIQLTTGNHWILGLPNWLNTCHTPVISASASMRVSFQEIACNQYQKMGILNTTNCRWHFQIQPLHRDPPSSSFIACN